MKVKKINPDAIVPTRAYDSQGIDLYAVDDYDIDGAYSSGGMNFHGLVIPIVEVKTGISIKIPDGYVGIIKEKSGLAREKKLAVRAGVIDSDYRGEIIVLLENHSSNTIHIKKGTKVAQLLIIKALTPNIEEVDDLDETDRGDKGFGSSDQETKRPVDEAVKKTTKKRKASKRRRKSK